MLHDRDARTLARARRRQRPMLLLGVLLLLGGAGYMLWGVQRLHSTPAVDEPGAFDRPVANLGRLSARAQDRLARLEPITPLERALVDELRTQTDATGRLSLLVLRLLLGSVVTTAGLVLLASALAERPLLSIVRRMGA